MNAFLLSKTYVSDDDRPNLKNSERTCVNSIELKWGLKLLNWDTYIVWKGSLSISSKFFTPICLLLAHLFIDQFSTTWCLTFEITFKETSLHPIKFDLFFRNKVAYILYFTESCSEWNTKEKCV